MHTDGCLSIAVLQAGCDIQHVQLEFRFYVLT